MLWRRRASTVGVVGREGKSYHSVWCGVHERRSARDFTREAPECSKTLKLGRFDARTQLRRLRAGVELEGGPVEGVLEEGVGVGGMEESEFGVTKGGGGVFALEEFAIEGVH